MEKDGADDSRRCFRLDESALKLTEMPCPAPDGGCPERDTAADDTPYARAVTKLFDSERRMHDLIESNIETLFPGLVLLDKFGMDGGGLLPDTVAFDAQLNTFVVLEYKNRMDLGVVGQTRDYLSAMERHREDLADLHRGRMGRNPRNPARFDWEGMYAIIVAPTFHLHQRKVTAKSNIGLYEFCIISGDAIGLTRAGGGLARRYPPCP